MTLIEGGQSINPIDALVQTLHPGQEPDCSDPKVREAIVNAITKLSLCNETMALLAQRMNLVPGAPYEEIRKQFPDGNQDED